MMMMHPDHCDHHRCSRWPKPVMNSDDGHWPSTMVQESDSNRPRTRIDSLTSWSWSLRGDQVDGPSHLSSSDCCCCRALAVMMSQSMVSAIEMNYYCCCSSRTIPDPSPSTAVRRSFVFENWWAATWRVV